MEAVEKVKNSTEEMYDLVLMDIQMPVMDGYEATRQIRAIDNSALSRVPIIAMTANAFSEDKQTAISVGMNGHVAKPIDINVLLPMILKILSNVKPIKNRVNIIASYNFHIISLDKLE